jgi:hypothetical protein
MEKNSYKMHESERKLEGVCEDVWRECEDLVVQIRKSAKKW